MATLKAKGLGLLALGVGATGVIVKVASDASSTVHASSLSVPITSGEKEVGEQFEISKAQIEVVEEEQQAEVTDLIQLEQVRVQEELDLSEKERIKKEADEAFRKMDDYSFRIFSSCGKGTGWILDYELTDDGSYPTTWYIATNAHVIAGYGFSENPYNQVLPNSKEKIKGLRWRFRGIDYSGMSLSQNAGTCAFTENYGYFDWNMSKADSGRELRSDEGAIQMNQIYEPKLFYVPINFLNENKDLGVEKNNYKDFAVLEIKFKDSKHAEKVTRDFADRYTVESTDAINIFADSLQKRIGWEKMDESTENFYSLAYPHIDGDKYNYTKTWDESKLEGDKLSEDKWNWYHDKNDREKVKGYISAKRIGKKIKWHDKEYSKIGHFYLLKNYPLAKGSSGSMHIDGKGNMIGLRSVGESGNGAMHTMVDPLRSEEIILKGEIKTPKYDLIVGADGQNSSYKQQVEAYSKNTWLNARGWKHITKDNLEQLKAERRKKLS